MVGSSVTVRDQGNAISAFASAGNFETARAMAESLSQSSLVPELYRSLPNTLIAMELANRIGCSVLMVMQNMAVVKGKPAWASTFLIASVNSSGRFTPLRFEWQGTQGSDDWGCRAVARDIASNDECRGALITVKMCKAEGWWSKRDRNGNEVSKWQTMPEQMFMYRAAAFWTRVYCPEIAMGIRPADELEDIQEAAFTVSEATATLDGALANGHQTAQDAPESTGILDVTLQRGKHAGKTWRELIEAGGGDRGYVTHWAATPKAGNLLTPEQKADLLAYAKALDEKGDDFAALATYVEKLAQDCMAVEILTVELEAQREELVAAQNYMGLRELEGELSRLLMEHHEASKS